MKKSILLLILSMMFAMNNSYAKEFSDIDKSFWAYPAIDKVTNEQYMDGYEGNIFRPSEYVTRADYSEMMIKVLHREDMHIETMYSFEDISNQHPQWKYVLKAINLDILQPADDGHFYPNDYVTRAEMITFLTTILKTEDITKKDAIIALQNYYLDFDDIPDWLKVTAGKAEVLGVIAKEPPRHQYLDHDKYITRAQMAVFLANFVKNIDIYIDEANKVVTTPRIADGLVIENLIHNGDIVTIPARASLPIMVLGRINSDQSEAGEMFKAKFVDNIVDKYNHLLLPKDTLLIGKIVHTTKSKKFFRNGELIFELSAMNNDELFTRIMAYAECETVNHEDSKIKRISHNVIKGKEFDAMEGQTLYVKLINPIKVNIVTGDIFER